MENEIKNLWEDFLTLGKSYQDKMQIQEFGGLLIMYASKIIFDVAPTIEIAKDTIQGAVQAGLKWSNEEKENDQTKGR